MGKEKKSVRKATAAIRSDIRLIPRDSSAFSSRPVFEMLSRPDERTAGFRYVEQVMQAHHDAMIKAANNLEAKGMLKASRQMRKAARGTFYPQTTTDPYTTSLKYMMIDSLLNEATTYRAIKKLITFTLGQQVRPKVVSRFDYEAEVKPDGSTTFNGVTVKNSDILKIITYVENLRDVDFRLKLQGLMKQAYGFGRAALGIVRGNVTYNGVTYKDMPIALRPLTSLLLGYVTINNETWRPESVVYASLTASMTNPVPMEDLIYLVHEDDNTQPRSVGYGTSRLLSSIHLSESVRMATERDIKEIMYSLWAGLFEIAVKTKNPGLVTAIKNGFQAGKNFVHNQDIVVTEHKIEHDLDKIMMALEQLSTTIARSVGVPSALLNHEEVQNKATLEGVLQAWEQSDLRDERAWLNDTIEDQWYDRILMSIFQTDKIEECPIKCVMDFTPITFLSLADLLPAAKDMKELGIFTEERIIKTLGMGQEVLAELPMARQEAQDRQAQAMQDVEMQAAKNAVDTRKGLKEMKEKEKEKEKHPPTIKEPEKE